LVHAATSVIPECARCDNSTNFPLIAALTVIAHFRDCLEIPFTMIVKPMLRSRR
jgi:hypothetical protein